MQTGYFAVDKQGTGWREGILFRTKAQFKSTFEDLIRDEHDQNPKRWSVQMCIDNWEIHLYPATAKNLAEAGWKRSELERFENSEWKGE